MPLGVPRFTMLKMFSAPPTRVRLYLRATVASSLGCACAPLSPRPFTLPFPPCIPPAPFAPFDFGANPDDFADAHVHHEIRGTDTGAIGNDFLPLADRIGIQAAVGGGNHVRLPAGAIGRTRVELVVRGEIVADHEVIRRSGLSREQWRKDNSMRRGVSSKQKEAVSDAEARAAVIKAGILGDRGNVVDALRIALCLVEGV